jgi:hypothetical protein
MASDDSPRVMLPLAAFLAYAWSVGRLRLEMGAIVVTGQF